MCMRSKDWCVHCESAHIWIGFALVLPMATTVRLDHCWGWLVSPRPQGTSKNNGMSPQASQVVGTTTSLRHRRYIRACCKLQKQKQAQNDFGLPVMIRSLVVSGFDVRKVFNWFWDAVLLPDEEGYPMLSIPYWPIVSCAASMHRRDPIHHD